VISIDPGSPVPPYEQLRAHLARQIGDRTLAVGTRLPAYSDPQEDERAG